jgi:hypothetical protein
VALPENTISPKGRTFFTLQASGLPFPVGAEIVSCVPPQPTILAMPPPVLPRRFLRFWPRRAEIVCCALPQPNSSSPQIVDICQRLRGSFTPPLIVIIISPSTSTVRLPATLSLCSSTYSGPAEISVEIPRFGDDPRVAGMRGRTIWERLANFVCARKGDVHNVV